jgi:hypothetical protein
MEQAYFLRRKGDTRPLRPIPLNAVFNKNPRNEDLDLPDEDEIIENLIIRAKAGDKSAKADLEEWYNITV